MSDVPVTSYQLDPAAFEASVRPRLLRGLLIRAALMMAAMAFGFMLVSLAQPGQEAPLPLMGVMFAVLTFFFARAGRNQLGAEKLAWHSYQLSLSPNAMRRSVANLSPVEILRPDVTHIVEAPGLGLTVRTADAGKSIFIPEQLAGFQSVRSELARWRALEPQAGQGRGHAAQLAFSLLVLGLWLATGLVPDIRLAMFAGVLLVACLVYSLGGAQRAPATNDQKAWYTLGIILLMLAPVARLALHLLTSSSLFPQ